METNHFMLVVLFAISYYSLFGAIAFSIAGLSGLLIVLISIEIGGILGMLLANGER